MKQTIFLDMDEVLADWTSAYLRWFDYRIQQREITRFEIWEFLGISKEYFWKSLEDAPVEFWEGIKPTSWASSIVRTVTEYSSEVYVLSNGAFGNAATGKHRWLLHYFPELQDRLMLVRDKFLCAGPSRLLIDDSPHQVESFLKYGGDAILIDRPWNISHQFDKSIIKRVTRINPMNISTCFHGASDEFQFLENQDSRFCGSC